MSGNGNADLPVQTTETSASQKAASFPRFLQKLVNGLDRIILPVNRVLYGLSKIVLFILMWLTCLDIVGRELFNKPITGTYELTGLMMVVIVFLSLSITQYYQEHIDITFLSDKLSPKAQAILSMVVYLVCFLFLIVLVWQFILYAQKLWQGNYISSDLRIPFSPFAIIASLGMIIFALSLLRDFFAAWLKGVDRHDA